MGQIVLMIMKLVVLDANLRNQKNSSSVSHQKVSVNLIHSVMDPVESAQPSSKQLMELNVNLKEENAHQAFVRAEIYNVAQ